MFDPRYLPRHGPSNTFTDPEVYGVQYSRCLAFTVCAVDCGRGPGAAARLRARGVRIDKPRATGSHSHTGWHIACIHLRAAPRSMNKRTTSTFPSPAAALSNGVESHYCTCFPVQATTTSECQCSPSSAGCGCVQRSLSSILPILHRRRIQLGCVHCSRTYLVSKIFASVLNSAISFATSSRPFSDANFNWLQCCSPCQAHRHHRH